MSDQATIKVNEAILRAREALAEEAKKPRPSARDYATVRDFVNQSRYTVLPGIEFHKAGAAAPEKTLVVLGSSGSGQKLEIEAGLLSQLLAEAAEDRGSRAKTVLRNAQASLDSYAPSIERARSGGPLATQAAGPPLRRIA